jgi:PAS domain S-box-containing protein
MKATDVFISELSLDRLLEKLTEICVEAISADRTVLAIRDGSDLVIRTIANAHGKVMLEDKPLHGSGSAPVSILEHVLYTGEAVILGGAGRETRFNEDPHFADRQVGDVMAVPIGHKGRMVGVMYFENATLKGAFSETHVERLRSVSDEIVGALEQSLLLEECRLTESRLRLLSDVSAALAESLGYGTCISRIGEIIVPAMADWFVLQVIETGKLRPVISAHVDSQKAPLVEALYRKYPVDLDSLHPEAVVLRSGAPLLITDVTSEFARTGVYAEEHSDLIRALEPGTVIISPLIAGRGTIGSAIFGRSRQSERYGPEDLALAGELARRIAQALENDRLHRELKKAMHQRVERDRVLNMTFRQLPGVVWTTDRDLRLSYIAGRLMRDLQPRPVAGTSIFDVLGTTEPTDPVIAHHRGALSGEPQSFQYNFAGRWYEVLVEPLRDGHGQVAGCVGAAFDITDQRTTEQRLARSETRLAEAQRVAHIGSFDWDIGLNVLTWSDELHRIYGLEPGQFGGTYEAFIERVLPDDLETTKTVLFDALRNIRPFVYEHRIVRGDGSVRILHTRGDVIEDDHGKPVRVAGSCWDVTEMREAIDKLEHARSLLEAAIESTADGLLIVNRDGKVVAYNHRFVFLWRIPSELAREGNDDRLLEYVLDQLEDPDGFVRKARELYDDPERDSFDVLHFKDGRVFERYATAQRIGEKIVGRVWSFRDVTERERLFRRALFLSDASRLLASLDVEPALDSVAHLAVPYLGDGCAIDLLGNGGPRRLLTVTRDPAYPVNAELHSAVVAGHVAVYAVGSRSYMAAPLVVKGTVVGAMTFVAAPSRRYNEQDLEIAEELARRAALSVENARLYRRAQEALEAREKFLSIAAHEIRGPIASIHLAVQGLEKGNVPPATLQRLMDIVEREDRRLARFVDELLDVGAIQTGRMYFKFERVNLGDVVREASSRLGADLSRTGSSLSIRCEGNPVGYWDRFRLEQVVTNLLSNAIKFGRGKPIEITVGEKPGIVTLMMKDQGIGIPHKMLHQIFNPFERAVSIRHYGGLGLGLFIVRTIVVGLGGTIRVESQPDVGSTFIVELKQVEQP